MDKSATETRMDELQAAIALTRDVASHPQAHDTFSVIKASLDKTDPEATEMLSLLWQELVATRRSVAFWQEISQVEKNLSERITENHIQLKQNYMRLIQEQ
ncbi:MAG: hypothetical protein AAF215_21425 [Cyanobacteria bacterium P01_A01_bin.123]